MSICNSLHIELHLICSIVRCTLSCHASFKPDMHHTCLCIMPCLCLCIYHVVCFFLGCLRFRSGVVRIRSTTSTCLLHGLVLLPSGISGKMTATLDLTTTIAMLVVSFYRYAALPIIYSSSLPNCHEHLTFDTLPSKPLCGYVTAFAQPLL